MTHDINSRARQLLVDIGLKEPPGDPPEIVAQHDMLVAFVADHLRQVAAEARETTNPCNKIFDHKWLSPECVETGCKSLLLTQRADGWRAKSKEWNLLYQTQAHSDAMMIRSLRALLAEAGEALKPFAHANWSADSRRAASTLASIQSALREFPTSDAKPLDFP